MKKAICVLMLFMLGSLVVLSGCGGGGGGSSAPPPAPPATGPFTVKFIISDEETGSILNVPFFITENNTNQTINGKTIEKSQITLNSGTYTVYFNLNDYITRGFVFNLNSNLTVKVALPKPQKMGERQVNIYGYVKDENDNPYTGLFKVVGGNGRKYEIDNDPDSNGGFNLIKVNSGEVIVSAYSVKNDAAASIEKIVYLRQRIDSDKCDLHLKLPGGLNTKTYSGTISSSEQLTVGLQDGYSLAEQKEGATNYSFKIQPHTGDHIILEAGKITSDGAIYINRIKARENGETDIPPCQLESLKCSISNYSLEITPVSFATHYEVCAIQDKGDELSKVVPFEIIVLSGTRLKLPKSLFLDGYINTTIVVRAVKLAQFDAAKILSGEQNHDSYSYVEKNGSFNLESGMMNSLSRGIQYRSSHNSSASVNRLCSKLGLNRLLSEK